MTKIAHHFFVRENAAESSNAPGTGAPIVKLHNTVRPECLGLASFSGERVKVSSATMNHLRNATDVLLRTQRVFPFGAGNQKADIVHSQGESAARTAMLLDQKPRTPPPIIGSKNAALYQGGKCRQHADVAYTLLAAQKIDAPVMMVSDQHQDHGYCLIGDPRDPRWGSTDTVVVDAWPGYPVASTLSQSANRNPAFPAHYQRSPGTMPLQAAVSALQDVQPVETAAVDHFLQSKGWPAVGPGLLDYLSRERDALNLRDERLAVQDPSAVYYSREEPIGDAMDDISQERIEKQRSGRVGLGRFDGA